MVKVFVAISMMSYSYSLITEIHNKVIKQSNLHEFPATLCTAVCRTMVFEDTKGCHHKTRIILKKNFFVSPPCA